jgi:hypothetical protein
MPPSIPVIVGSDPLGGWITRLASDLNEGAKNPARTSLDLSTLPIVSLLAMREPHRQPRKLTQYANIVRKAECRPSMNEEDFDRHLQIV